MVAAAEANGSASEEWIAWARAKADWYDPTVAAADAFFGKRKHEESEDKKALREKGRTILTGRQLWQVTDETIGGGFVSLSRCIVS